jgi:ATP-dependent Clp protease protease subunit
MTEEFTRTKKRLNELLVVHTGQSLEQIEKDTDRNNFMSPQEALAYGLIDKVYGTKRDNDK